MIGLLDLLLGGVPWDAQDGVIVLSLHLSTFNAANNYGDIMTIWKGAGLAGPLKAKRGRDKIGLCVWGRKMKSWVLAITVFLATCLSACAARLSGLWETSGETKEGRFFSFILNNKDEKAVYADLSVEGEGKERLAVCDLVTKEDKVSFKMDIEGRAKRCEDMKGPYLFDGVLGRDVITGRILNPEGEEIGIFRAFRLPQ